MPKNECPVFSGLFFRPTSDVDISETVCPNYLKFDVRIVLYKVCFRDIDVGSRPKNTIRKNGTLFFGHPLKLFKYLSILILAQKGIILD